MIKQYLEKTMNAFLDDKSSLDKKNTDIQNRIEEIERFIEILSEKNDPSFESFTPREVNAKNKEKIKELEEEKKILQKDLLELKKKIDENEKSRDEIDSMLQYLKKQRMEERAEEKLIEEQENVSHEKNNEIRDELEEVDAILNKVNTSLQFISVDTARTKLELQQLLPQLELQIEKIKGLL